MIRIKLNSAKNLGIVYHFTSTLDDLSSILDYKQIKIGKTSLDKPLVCVGDFAHENYLKKHIYDWNYGVMLDGNVLLESYVFTAYESYAHNLQDISIILRCYYDPNNANEFYTIQCGEERPYTIGTNTAKKVNAFINRAESNPESFYDKTKKDHDPIEVWKYDGNEEFNYPSITIKGNKADCNFAIMVTGTFIWNKLPKAIQDLLVKSGYKAEERIWLIERKNSYTQKGDIPFIDISHVIEGIVLPKSKSQDPKILDLLDRYKDKIVSGTWKILWYQD
ncbi:MAG: hypothetical protein ACI4WH_08075 [Oscillospiraceae bacterium]